MEDKKFSAEFMKFNFIRPYREIISNNNGYLSFLASLIRETIEIILLKVCVFWSVLNLSHGRAILLPGPRSVPVPLPTRRVFSVPVWDEIWPKRNHS